MFETSALEYLYVRRLTHKINSVDKANLSCKYPKPTQHRSFLPYLKLVSCGRQGRQKCRGPGNRTQNPERSLEPHYDYHRRLHYLYL